MYLQSQIEIKIKSQCSSYSSYINADPSFPICFLWQLEAASFWPYGWGNLRPFLLATLLVYPFCSGGVTLEAASSCPGARFFSPSRKLGTR
ncbi:hypothetical protein ERO13_D06G028050v2 [Gossypium hirsutum]|nr:hypothetical protein ERO13_D06G028050v2 [Gossypium hirsutum]